MALGEYKEAMEGWVSGLVWNMGCGYKGMTHMPPLMATSRECLADERSHAGSG